MLEFDGTLIVIAISFVIFILVMQKIFYGPISQVRKSRSKYIEGNNKAAEESLNEVKRVESFREEQLLDAKRKSKKIVATSNQNANAKRFELLQEAEEKAQKFIVKEKAKIENSKEKAKKELEQEALVLAQLISTKILGEEVPISGIDTEIIEKTMRK